MLLEIRDELGDDDVAKTLQAAVLCKEAAAADGDDHAVEERETLSGGGRFSYDVQAGFYMLSCGRNAVFCELQKDASLLGELSLVNSSVTDCLAHFTTLQIVHEIQKHSQLTVDDWRGGCSIISRGLFLHDQEGSKLRHPAVFADHSAQLLDVSEVDETSDLDRLVYVKELCLY